MVRHACHRVPLFQERRNTAIYENTSKASGQTYFVGYLGAPRRLAMPGSPYCEVHAEICREHEEDAENAT